MYLEIYTVANLFAKPGLMSDTLLILALLCFRSLWLFLISMYSFSPNCWSRLSASQNVVQPFTSRLVINTPRARWMTCVTRDMWFLNVVLSIPGPSIVDCISLIIEQFEEAFEVVLPSTQPSKSSKGSRMCSNCMGTGAPVCWWLTSYASLAFEIGIVWAINLIKSELYFLQCPIAISIARNDWHYSQFVCRCPPFES